jgi:hypothetical protein
MLTSNQCEQVVAAIYRTEGGEKTKHPYGVLTHYQHTTPHDACFNTVMHAAKDWRVVKVDRAFVYMLADRYCPPSCDPTGNKNWKVNMVRILNPSK